MPVLQTPHGVSAASGVNSRISVLVLMSLHWAHFLTQVWIGFFTRISWYLNGSEIYGWSTILCQYFGAAVVSYGTACESLMCLTTHTTHLFPLVHPYKQRANSLVNQIVLGQ